MGKAKEVIDSGKLGKLVAFMGCATSLSQTITLSMRRGAKK
jgi:hypothetical protein